MPGESVRVVSYCLFGDFLQRHRDGAERFVGLLLVVAALAMRKQHVLQKEVKVVDVEGTRGSGIVTYG